MNDAELNKLLFQAYLFGQSWSFTQQLKCPKSRQRMTGPGIYSERSGTVKQRLSIQRACCKASRWLRTGLRP